MTQPNEQARGNKNLYEEIGGVRVGEYKTEVIQFKCRVHSGWSWWSVFSCSCTTSVSSYFDPLKPTKEPK